MPRHQQAEVDEVEDQKLGQPRGGDIGGPQVIAEQRHFAEERSILEQDLFPGQFHFHLSRGDEVHAVADRATSANEQQSAGSAFEVVVNRLEDLGVPTICRLNGGVYGGSTDLALACDFRIGVDTAEMFMPAARLGLHYYRSGIERYVTRLGVDNAKKLFLTAQKISAPEMLRIGYLTAMVSVEYLDEEVDKLATLLAGNAPVAMRGMKRTINEFARGKLDEAAAERRHRESMRGAEIKEGIKASAEKRPPRF